MTSTRKIAAILAADIVGFSRMARADEERTLARLRALRSDVIDPTIAVHNGRVFKRTGDGVLAEFRSAVDAVRCGVEFQAAIAERNAGVAEDRRIAFRLGVHVGDIVEESDGDLMGDGVNVAARLEGVCEPGGVCLSEDAYRQVRDKLDFDFRDAGEKALKNIARPLRVYAIDPAPRSPALPAEPQAPQRLSIVVLPFANMSGDPAQEYFVDGVTDSLTTCLAQLADWFVIGRNTAFTYKGRAVDLKQVGRELNVRYALEGSVQRHADRMRVIAQLTDTQNGHQLWADRFDKPIADLFDMQDEIVARLANVLPHWIYTQEAQRAARQVNPDALDYFFRGYHRFNNARTAQDLDEARGFFERVLTIEPANVHGLVGVATVDLFLATGYFVEDRNARFSAAKSLLERALAIAPNNAMAHLCMGVTQIQMGRVDEGVRHCERSLELNPNLAFAHAYIGVGMSFLGKPEETELHIVKALTLSPRDTGAYVWFLALGSAKFILGEVEGSISLLRQSIEYNRNFAWTHFVLAAALSHIGQIEDAHIAVEAGLALNPTFTISRYNAGRWNPNKAMSSVSDRFVEDLRSAGVPE